MTTLADCELEDATREDDDKQTFLFPAIISLSLHAAHTPRKDELARFRLGWEKWEEGAGDIT